MKHLLVGMTLAMTLAAIHLARAQVPAGQPPSYPAPYGYRSVEPDPEDAYRRGLINRWELEQRVGPIPQALQGPSPNGSRGEGFN